MDQIKLVTEGWATPAHLARSFLDRWRGVKRVVGPFPLLLPTRSVHGVGLDAPILVVPIDAGLKVGDIRILQPGRFLTFPGARYVLEMPLASKPPPLGSTLELRHG